ncbi:MAG TPA: hypothetical protein VI386_35290 [Candidatus Sulfotelmatobacter sp.]
MSSASLHEDVISRMSAESNAIGRLAQDTGGFAAVVAAFEARDPNAFRWSLERLGFVSQCELICEWIRVKLGVLRCIEVCGPPREKVEVPSLQEFARAVVHLAANEKLLRRVVDAVSCGDGEAYRAALAELKLTDFCYLLCHWVYSIIYRQVCDVVCTHEFLAPGDAVHEIRAAGKLLSDVTANKKSFEAINKAVISLNCELAQSAIEQAGFGRYCEIICGLICSWRCAWVCREICVFPVPVSTGFYGVEEARHFALASQQLVSQPRAMNDLVSAVLSRDTEAYGSIVQRFGLGPYCAQLCALVCSIACREFCICICPNPAFQPWFTRVGYFDIYADIDGTSGKTNKGLPPATLDYHGGPNFAFHLALQLEGFCPSFSPTSPSTAMKYRFLYMVGTSSGTGLPITGNLVSPVEAGTRTISWPPNLAGKAGPGLVQTFQTITIQAAPTPPDPIPPALGAPWYGPSAHYISPDADGWVEVDPNAIGGGYQTLMGFDSTQAVPGGAVTGLTAGNAVPGGSQRAGTDLSITFEATRTTLTPAGTAVPPTADVDYWNELNKIHINNWIEVNLLDFAEFSTGCCTGIDQTLSVKFTVDHEEMDTGAWSLDITSCSASAPGDITPAASGGSVTVSARGGSGTIVEDTSTWTNCSYTATLTTRAALTTGIVDNDGFSHSLTFCICSH